MVALLRIGLAAVLLVAGAGKLLDRRGARKSLRGFGVPAALAGPGGLLLAVAEIAAAVALVPVGSARMGALAALVLLGAMLVATSRAMLRGDAPECHCFGALHSAPVGRGTVVRIVGLMGVATVVLVTDIQAATNVQLAGVAAVTVLGVQSLLVMRVLRRYGRALRRIDELERGRAEAALLAPGAPAPAFALPALDGGRVTLADLLADGTPLLLAFVDPLCGPCRALLPRLAAWESELAGRFRVTVVSGGDRDQVAEVIASHALGRVLLRDDGDVAARYGAEATPSALVIAADGTVSHGVAAGTAEIERLVAGLDAPAPGPAPAVSAAAAGAAAAVLPLTLVGEAVAAGGSDAELAQVRALLGRVLKSQLAGAQRGSRALGARNLVSRSPAGRRALVRARRGLAAERDDVTSLRRELVGLRLDTLHAHRARQQTLAFLSSREAFLADVSRFPSADRTTSRRRTEDARIHLTRAFSHLRTALDLTRS